MSSFFQDMLSGGGNLYRHIVPREIRNLVPKEISPGGFNPGRDWFGMDLDGSLTDEAKAKEAQRIAAENAYGQSMFNQSATMPIPGVTGPATPMQPPPATGLLGGQGPTLREIPNSQQPVAQFQPMGPYGETAMQMAGLLQRRPRRGLLGGGGGK